MRSVFLIARKKPPAASVDKRRQRTLGVGLGLLRITGGPRVSRPEEGGLPSARAGLPQNRLSRLGPPLGPEFRHKHTKGL